MKTESCTSSETFQSNDPAKLNRKISNGINTNEYSITILNSCQSSFLKKGGDIIITVTYIYKETRLQNKY